MSVVAGIEPSLRVSRFLGLITFDMAFESSPRLRARSWLLAVLNLCLQVYELTTWIIQDRVSHQFFIIGFSQCTAIFVLATCGRISKSLSRLRAFNEGEFPLRKSSLRKFSRRVSWWNWAFCVGFVASRWIRDGEPGWRFVLRIVGLFGRFAGFSFSCAQVAAYFSLVGSWYTAINDTVALAGHRSSKDTVRLVGEADSLIKDFNDDVAHVYSFFILLTFAATLFESIYSSTYYILNPEADNREMIIVLLFIAYLIVQVCVLVTASTSAVSKARDTGLLLQGMLAEEEDSIVRDEVQLLSLQFIHRKLEFTACRFFALDFSLISSMAGAVATYILVLIQLQDVSNGTKCPRSSTQ